MAYREFRDDEGRVWEVWDVVPERRDRRGGVDRRHEFRDGSDRRKRRVLSAVVSGDLAKGWLVFTTAAERRRYVPIPEGWTEASEAQLIRWCSEAKPLPASRRPFE